MLWLFAVFALIMGAQALLLGTFSLKGVSYSRAFDRKNVHEGESVTLVEVLSNPKPVPVPWLRAESRISPHLRFSGNGEDEIRRGGYHHSAFFLSPLTRLTRRHPVLCQKRGVYQVGQVAITAGDMLGLVQKSRTLSADCTLTVYPALLPAQDVPIPSSRFVGELPLRRFILPDPYLVGGIREMVPGDALRDVHWGATARTGRHMVKVRDFTADPRLLVVLNVQMQEGQWGELMPYEQGTLENGLRIAATLCARALSFGVEAGFASNGCLAGEEAQTVLVPPLRGPEALPNLLSVMARLMLRRKLTFPTFLDELAQLTGMDILILTAYESPAIAQKAHILRRRGNSVLVQVLPHLHDKGEQPWQEQEN